MPMLLLVFLVLWRRSGSRNLDFRNTHDFQIRWQLETLGDGKQFANVTLVLLFLVLLVFFVGFAFPQEALLNGTTSNRLTKRIGKGEATNSLLSCIGQDSRRNPPWSPPCQDENHDKGKRSHRKLAQRDGRCPAAGLSTVWGMEVSRFTGPAGDKEKALSKLKLLQGAEMFGELCFFNLGNPCFCQRRH